MDDALCTDWLDFLALEGLQKGRIPINIFLILYRAAGISIVGNLQVFRAFVSSACRKRRGDDRLDIPILAFMYRRALRLSRSRPWR
jgi:hypothetical protein